MNELVAHVDGRAVTTSLKVAEVFDKRHADVIRAIELLQVPDDWYKRNFAFIQNDTDLGFGRTRQDKAYQISRDGFTILAMDTEVLGKIQIRLDSS